MPASTFLSIPVRTSLALLLAAAAGAAHAEVVYHAREVIGPDGTFLFPTAMNNAGSVAGWTGDDAQTALHGSFTLKARGAYASFQPFGARSSEIYGINDLGDTVGYAMSAPRDMAYFKPAGKEPIALFAPDGKAMASYADVVNNSGVVAGMYITADDRRHAFAWKAGALTKLPSLGGRTTYVSAINASGEIAGGSKADTGNNHAVKWVNGVLIDLGGLGYTHNFGDHAYAINDAGWVAGYCSVANFQISGCIWHDGVIDELPPLVAGSWSEVRAINNSNVAVGRAGYPNSGGHAVIWTNGVISDLNKQVNLPASMTLEVAHAINNKGRILAYGFDTALLRQRHFVLSPITTP